MLSSSCPYRPSAAAFGFLCLIPVSNWPSVTCRQIGCLPDDRRIQPSALPFISTQLISYAISSSTHLVLDIPRLLANSLQGHPGIVPLPPAAKYLCLIRPFGPRFISEFAACSNLYCATRSRTRRTIEIAKASCWFKCDVTHVAVVIN